MEGNVAAVGAPQNDEANLNGGKVFIYEKVGTNWQLVEEFFSDTGGQNEYFGSEVLLKNGYLFVSAPGRDFNGVEALGGVAVYKKVSGTWTYLNTLVPSDNSPLTQFGTSIAFNGSILAIGAAYSNGGAVYIFNDPTSQASFVTKILLDAAETPGRFGVSLAANSTTLFVGDSFCGQSSNLGAVFVYDVSNFSRIAKLVSSPTENFYFATCLSATETELAVGSPYVTNPDFSYGSVFLYKKPAGGWVDAAEDVRFSSMLSDDYGAYGSSIFLTDASLIIGTDGGTALDFYDKPAGGWSAAAAKFTWSEDELTVEERYGSSFATNGTDVFVGAYHQNVINESSGAVYQYTKGNSEWSSLEPAGILREYSISASESSFGFDVDIDGQYAVVGSPYDDKLGKDAGAAYVFKLVGNEWQKMAKLSASDGKTGDYFGFSVAISGERIIISAREADRIVNNGVSTYGKVYVFQKPSGNEWSDSHESDVIDRVDDLKEGSFGYKVDIKGNLVAISHFREGGSDEIGKVYLLEKVGAAWQLKATLSPTANTVRLFGYGITLDEGLLAVSSTFEIGFRGAVLIFEKPASGWTDATQNAILSPSDPTFSDGFGTSVAIDDNTIIVGGTQPYPSDLTGAAYVYEKTAAHWVNATETVKLLAEAEAPGSRFGFSVALSGDLAAVGSIKTNAGNGKILLFRKTDDEWETAPYAFLEMPSSGGTNEFGYAMDMGGDHLAIGATGASSSSGKGAGSVEFYTTQPPVVATTEDIDSDVQVYPNPFAGYVRVTGSNIQSIELLDTNGKLILTSSKNFGEVVTADLKKGVYLLRIMSGKKPIYRRVIKY